MLTKEIFVKEPKENALINNGVAELSEDTSEEAVKVLRYELETFVCNGQYEKGLDRIFTTFLGNIGKPEQPGIWISGFYGSGKSHLAKVLRYIWTDYTFSDGATARSLVTVPTSISDHMKEFSTQVKRVGGACAASGKLGASASSSIRVALQEIVFRSVGLPEKHHRGSFVLWLKKNGFYDNLINEIEGLNEDIHEELKNMYVSPILAKALLKVYPDLAASEKEARQILKAQFPEKSDLSNDELIDAIHDAFSIDDTLPLSLVVLDEVQQYIGDNAERAYLLQEAVETCCKHFGGKLLFVGTGQTALSGTPNLQKLMGRFTVPIELSDNDVEGVIREIILAKKPSAIPEVKKIIDSHLGELSRHLQGTKIAHGPSDEAVMVTDYPILPVRRRFWERVLRVVDASGTVAQLRNQLRIVHEAVLSLSGKPLGNVVAADFLYDQNASSLLQTAILPREIFEHIQRLSQGSTDEVLKASILKLIFLINKLPVEPVADTGIRATADCLADLLVTDLNTGSGDLRKKVPELLADLADKDALVLGITTPSGVEYRLQTKESSEWQRIFRQEESSLKSAPNRIDLERIELIKSKTISLLKTLRLSQGSSKESRDITPSFDTVIPANRAGQIYVWIQDGWRVDETSFTAEVRRLGTDDPTVCVYLPAMGKTELANAIVTKKAAETTLAIKGTPATPEGQEAHQSMETRLRAAGATIEKHLDDILKAGRVFQAGGAEITAGVTLTEKVQDAAGKSMIRLYDSFDMADDNRWSRVFEQAKKNDASCLSAIGYSGDVEKHPVCAEVMRFISTGKKGSEIREQFKKPPYGWPQDAIDGALFALLVTGHVSATDASGKPADVKSIERSKITQTSYRAVTVVVSAIERIEVRKLIQHAGIGCQPNEEQIKAVLLIEELKKRADMAGGDAPQPEKPSTSVIEQIAALSGNELLKSLYDKRETLAGYLDEWKTTSENITRLLPQWNLLTSLVRHIEAIPDSIELLKEYQAIIDQRALLNNPDPVAPLVKRVSDRLRTEITKKVNDYDNEYSMRASALKEDEVWKQLKEPDRTSIWSQFSLNKAGAPDIGSTEALSTALEICSLERWDERRQALQGKFQAAHTAAVQLLQPKAVPVDLPRRIVSSPDEVKAWTGEVEKLLLEKIKKGPVAL